MSDSYLGKEVAGQFRIVEKIGKGGMGAVYRAEQPDMNRYVAIKMMAPQFAANGAGAPGLFNCLKKESARVAQVANLKEPLGLWCL